MTGCARALESEAGSGTIEGDMVRVFSLVTSVAVATTVLASTAWASAVPSGRTPVAKLAPAGFEHHQVLRIDQDFHPNASYDIALDAWIDKRNPGAIAEVRMWWQDTSSSDERSPFGKGVRRHIDIDYAARGDGSWDVTITQGRKRYGFEVERTAGGNVEAYADVQAGRETIERCRVLRSRLVARKMLGLPVGLKHLAVTCTDADGKRHRGHVVRK